MVVVPCHPARKSCYNPHKHIERRQNKKFTL